MRKRVAACFCAVLVLVNCVLFPFRARATAGALAAVGAAVTVSAFLMACGVYPYISEDGQSFGEWGAESLYDLWTQYVDSFEGGNLPSGGTVETFNQIKAFVVGNTLAIASGTWETLRGFANWIVSHFSLTDNQTGVQIGVSASKGQLPVVASANASLIQSQGVYLGKYYYTNSSYTDGWVAALSAGYYLVGIRIAGTSVYQYMIYTVHSSNQNQVCRYSQYWATEFWNDFAFSTTWNGQRVIYGQLSTSGNWKPTALVKIPLYESQGEALADIFGNQKFSGIVADTTTVAPLEALPADTPWGGLSVQGTLNPVGAVEQGITEREKPVVRPVEVEIGAGTEVDSETGEVTENPVVITPGDVVLPASDYQVPGLSGVFPFSLPWDIYRIYSALNAEPVRPEWDVTIYVPILEIQTPMHIGFPEDVAPAVDNFMSLARKLILILLCVMTLIGVRNLIR